MTSFFAPASRSGTPEELKYLVDTAHGALVRPGAVRPPCCGRVGAAVLAWGGSGAMRVRAGCVWLRVEAVETEKKDRNSRRAGSVCTLECVKCVFFG